MKKLRFLSLIVIVLISCGKPKGPAPTPVTVYNVVLANDPRLPAVSEDKIKEALKIASEWIEKWYQKRIRFEISGREEIDTYVISHLENPPLPPEWLEIPYALGGSDNVERFVSEQKKNISKYSI